MNSEPEHVRKRVAKKKVTKKKRSSTSPKASTRKKAERKKTAPDLPSLDALIPQVREMLESERILTTLLPRLRQVTHGTLNTAAKLEALTPELITLAAEMSESGWLDIQPRKKSKSDTLEMALERAQRKSAQRALKATPMTKVGHSDDYPDWFHHMLQHLGVLSSFECAGTLTKTLCRALEAVHDLTEPPSLTEMRNLVADDPAPDAPSTAVSISAGVSHWLALNEDRHPAIAAILSAPAPTPQVDDRRGPRDTPASPMETMGIARARDIDQLPARDRIVRIGLATRLVQLSLSHPGGEMPGIASGPEDASALIASALAMWERDRTAFVGEEQWTTAICQAVMKLIIAIMDSPTGWTLHSPLVWALEVGPVRHMELPLLQEKSAWRHPRCTSIDPDAVNGKARWDDLRDFSPDSSYWSESLAWWQQFSPIPRKLRDPGSERQKRGVRPSLSHGALPAPDPHSRLIAHRALRALLLAPGNRLTANELREAGVTKASNLADAVSSVHRALRREWKGLGLKMSKSGSGAGPWIRVVGRTSTDGQGP